jgi:hypothetical protein
MVGLISSHPTLAVTIACALYLSAVVVWPRGESEPRQPAPYRSPLRIDNVVVQECMLGSEHEVLPGRVYSALLIDFFNDPSRNVPVTSLSAKLTFYDQNGNAYASVSKAHWRTYGRGPDILSPGGSASLVLALTDCADAAFTVEQRYETGTWHGGRVGLKSGEGSAIVRVSHLAAGQIQMQEFQFSLLLCANPTIRQTFSASPGTS